MECSGDDSEFCGGRDAISVYEFHNATVSHGSFLGCYTDDRNDRVMVLEASLSTMSTEVGQAVNAMRQYRKLVPLPYLESAANTNNNTGGERIHFWKFCEARDRRPSNHGQLIIAW